jgi:hypothetical protein
MSFCKGRFFSGSWGKRLGTKANPRLARRLEAAPEFNISMAPRGSKVAPAQAMRPPLR